MERTRLTYDKKMSISIARMEKDVVVEDVDDHNIDRQRTENSSPQIFPTTLFIPHGKFQNQSSTGNQTIVSPSAAQLAAIINPVNNQVCSIKST